MTEQAELIAFYELTQAKAKYCRTLDTQDWNGLAALMIAGIEFGMSDGDSEPQMTVGRDETLALLNLWWRGRGPLTKSTHPRSTSTETKRR